MFQYYGRNVSKLKIGTLGSIEIFGEKKLGNINHNIPAFFDMTYEILDNNQLIAIKWNLRIFVNELKSKVTSVIHPSGKISFYYESITTEMEDNKRYSLIRGVFQCVRRDKDVVIEPQIIVPEKWIKSDTLVEFVPIEITCSEYNSIDECLNSKTFNMECIWCEKTNMCINSHELIVKDCHIENMTSEIIVYSKPNGTLYYLQIVLPIVILFWVVCTGCVIWIWLSRRKKNRLIHTTADVKCAWCEETDKYIQSNDKNSPEVKVIDHRVEDVDHLNTETLSYHNQTSLESTEVEIDDVIDTNE
ncbi:unnamed protein product [Schistosoma rodhaini]|uniref:Egg protein CP391S-like protein n=2 Tax=Schistosoma rodhaini TaxID=6188 RepID=A0AA85G7S5_9TREM|nr:unnamed protein product [Schistosoma rodhaini]